MVHLVYCDNTGKKGEKVLDKILNGTKTMVVRGAAGRKIPHSRVFLTASAEARARRRLLELESKGVSSSFEEVLKDIEYRNIQDSSRAAAPLKAAEDAVLVDTSELDFEQSLALLAELVVTRLAPEGAREE